MATVAAVTQRSRLAPLLRAWAPTLVLIALCLLITAVNPRFMSLDNLVRILNAAAIPLVLATGVTFVILMGSIDLSIEGIVAVCAVLTSLLVANAYNGNDLGFLAVPIVLAVGALMGLVNGLVHVKLRIPSFMATLGTGFAGIGIATLILSGERVRITDATFRELALGRLAGIPIGVWVSLAALGLAWVIQEYTRLGRWTYAIGGGEDLAKISGVPVDRVRVLIFTLAGLFFALGGILSAAQLGQGHALMGQGRLFTAITAVVVGGTALWGGIGGVLQSFVGVLIVVTLANGMVLMGIPPYVQQGVQGLLIIAAVALSMDRVRSRIVK